MVLVKALPAVLAVVSLSMADISGIVTDTGSTPISGAVVQLEKGGQKSTTVTDGSFRLVVSTAVIPGNAGLLSNGPSARISDNRLTVTIAQRSAVEVTTFDLNGKSLSTVRQSMAAGSHSLSLPYLGAGIYLYKVKSGNSEFVLKGNAVGVITTGSPVTAQGSSSNHPAKQAKVTAAINDVISVIKTGYLDYRCVQYNSDTTGIRIKMIVCADTVKDADGNLYHAVRIGNQVWTVENLRVTKYNDGSAIPLDTSTATWKNDTTPKYCFYNNMTTADSIKKFGALYNWYVVNPANSKKIAPAGWHVPTDPEWTIMGNYLVLNGYNWDGTRDTSQDNKIAKSMAAKTDWYAYSTAGTIGSDLTINNSSGFSALPGGCRNNVGTFNYQGDSGFGWSATVNGASHAYYRDLGYDYGYLSRSTDYKNNGYSVRLLKN